MRNTSKLKLILAKFDVALSMTEEELMTLSLVDKDSGDDVHFQHKTYSWLVGKAYSHLLKSVKLPAKKASVSRRR